MTFIRFWNNYLSSFGIWMLFALTGVDLFAWLCNICNICDTVMQVPEKINSLNFVIKSWKSPWQKVKETCMNHGNLISLCMTSLSCRCSFLLSYTCFFLNQTCLIIFLEDILLHRSLFAVLFTFLIHYLRPHFL